jgi:hypothetical protein
MNSTNNFIVAVKIIDPLNYQGFLEVTSGSEPENCSSHQITGSHILSHNTSHYKQRY